MAKLNSKKRPNVHTTRGRTTVRHSFTTEEWKEQTEALTRKMQEATLQEDEIKAQAATAKAKLKRLKSEVNDLANELRNGYRMQEVDVTIEFDRKKGIKRFYHFAPGKPYNGDFIQEAAMTEADFQELPMEEGGGKAAGEPAAPAEPQAAEGQPGFNPVLVDGATPPAASDKN